MFINGLPVSSLFCYTALLCLHQCLLHTPLTLYVLLPFMLCVPCPFNAPFLFCSFLLLCSASFFTRQPHSTTTTTLISSLFCILIVSILLVHAICHASACSHHTNVSTSGCSLPLHHSTTSLPQASTLSLFCIFSSCRVLSLIIMATL
jgi:hypothetical protein